VGFLLPSLFGGLLRLLYFVVVVLVVLLVILVILDLTHFIAPLPRDAFLLLLVLFELRRCHHPISRRAWWPRYVSVCYPSCMKKAVIE
jgi:hypothetical protein